MQRSYRLYIRVKKRVRVTVGSLGEFWFPAGLYVYTGSGKRNIASRVHRHLSKAKRLRWHVDYLLAKPEVAVSRVELFAARECRLNQETGGEIVVPGFGSSDCRSGCGSHLKYLGHQQRNP